MSTVKDANEVLAAQKLNIKLPHPEHWEIKEMEILEKKDYPDSVHVLLGLKMINDEGKEISDLYYSESKVEREPKLKMMSTSLKKKNLPLRDKMAFDAISDAQEYIEIAIKSLIEENGYTIEETSQDYILATKNERDFYICIVPIYGDECMKKLNLLISYREQYGDSKDYGIVSVAFQKSLGVSRLDQDQWMAENIEKFSTNHVGLYAVDNLDPNSIYPLTIYPKDKDLRRYFIKKSTQWTLLKTRDTAYRPGSKNTDIK
ncbi:MAG TPA: hypothetical protein DD405_06930 [Desulfobacteraceae bacterium]|nr:hypothetical protein [Desulfobacteraceae bacterium]